ncbi:CHAD domain-containing protein [Nocardioides sp.]|uniref:CYTH and CHAD domain-containing protein n=1 Tax=Nocardioides sp. TaxID=35761 RepID=UPI00286A8B27|nr:CHAD domain-containing protein [Nocardioides sp.]
MIIPIRALRAGDEGRIDIGPIVSALSAHYMVVIASRQLVRRVRLDTFDRRLRRAGLTLEHQRTASGERVVVGRSDPVPTLVAPAKDLQWPAHADVLPAGPVREAIAGVAGIRALMVVSDEKRRMSLLELDNKDAKTVVRVELDEPVSAGAGPACLTVLTLRGYDEHGRRAERILIGLGLRAVEADEGRETVAGPPKLRVDRAVPASVLLTSALRDFSATMLTNLPGLLDDVDTEFLHDFRVAVRRTRSTLKLGRAALPEVMRTRWEPEFKWLGDLTTPVRDLDVYELALPTMEGWLMAADAADLEPLSRFLRRRRTSERRSLVRGLRSARFRRLVMEWEEQLTRLAETPEGTDGEHMSAARLADRSLSLAYRRVLRGGADISDDSPAEDLHRLRRRCKELRYALEVFAPVVDKGSRKRAVAQLKGLQDVLGRFQDTEVHRQALRGFAGELIVEGAPAEAMLAMGELIGHLDSDQDRARREFEGAFANFTRPSSQRLMHQIGGGR